MNNESENKIVRLTEDKKGLPMRRVTASKISRERIRDCRNYSRKLNEILRIEKIKN